MIRRLFKKLVGSGDSSAKDSKSGKKSGASSGAAGKKAQSAPPKPVSNKPDLKAKTPEAMCGINPKTMDKEAIKEKLAELYRRHNHAAGSLNDELREEAEQMLDAIVACREKYVDNA
ncbi:MAG: hypothetical protein HKN23_01300 [Verrucomicrobiales bacterium]|nr:hypothetical protein [Verrucomicrobiales bacterium]